MKILGRQVGWGGGEVVRLVVGVLLLIAAGLKAYDLATGPVLRDGILQSRWFLIGVVEFELLLGLWLLSGVDSAHARAVSVACFVCFTCVTLHKALSGEASCGCFGRVEVNPWVTLGMDVLVVACLMCWRPTMSSLSRRLIAARVTAVLLVATSVGVPLTMGMANSGALVLTESGDLLGSGDFVVLDPDLWVGERCPLLGYMNIGRDLERGDWIVLLYEYECGRCREAIPNYEHQARRLAKEGDACRVALIEISSHDERGAVIAPNCYHGRLDASREWFAATPIQLRIHDGVVTTVSNPDRRSG